MSAAPHPSGHPARDVLALALDLDDLDEARALARRLAPYFRVAKVGLELYAAAGPRAVELLRADGFDVFVDVKLHDIPTTVGRSARVLGRLAPAYVTVHTAGGGAMVRAAVEGLAQGGADAGAARTPMALGVSVLTSDPRAAPTVLEERARLTVVAGCGGVVCAATDLALVRRVAPGLLAVVPGTRPPGAPHDDQARVATPAEALAAGAGLLVVGRSVTRAPDPGAAAAALAETLAPS
ncbi:MAG TPA: orotidine-5'-phosphate decarboxylase [Acidimicrobiales bacterium]|nr:orotidine-5'-phosphate decarboxylase [Acidimicrobiales bacterium]